MADRDVIGDDELRAAGVNENTPDVVDDKSNATHML